MPFVYQRAPSLRSFLWSLWLGLPPRWRGAVYRFVVHRLGRRQDLSYAFRVPWAYAKLCRSLDEALATEYVRTHTTIPVPQIIDVVPSGQEARPWIMISTCLPGTPLFIHGAGHRLLGASEQQLQRVKDDIRDWIAQLRTLKSPYGQRVCGFAGGALKSFRIGEEPVGPFETVADFHAQPFCTVYDAERLDLHVQQLISARARKTYAIHLVHGDLVLHNILADDDLCPTGLIDWECAAWTPEYWETAASSHSHYRWMWCWKDILPVAFPTYVDDLIIDTHIQLSQCG